LLGSSLFAQNSVRTDFTIHVYADAIYGDDARALALNPSSSGAKKPLMAHSNQSNTPVNGYLQQMPYSFKTVTAAISWITSNGFASGAWKNPQTNRYIRKIVIHCLPGLYGPIDPNKTTEIDGASGLPWNGEKFPLLLPNNVSIQGTSALDTVFDGRGSERASWKQALIVAKDPSVAGQDVFLGDFIDGLTLRGARGDNGSHPAPAGAAIYIEAANGFDNRLNVTNCFIVDNTVGVALGAVTPENHVMSPAIINNTFVGNDVGIWSGQPVPNILPNSRKAFPRILNNIIDTKGGISAFEGVITDDLAITIGTGSYRIFQAWDGPKGTPTPTYGRANLGSMGVPGGWPVTVATGTPIVPLSVLGTAVDIQPFTNAGNTSPHGILFIRDLLDAGIPGVSNYSSHDFRIAPHVGTSASSPPTTRSPFVNAGSRQSYATSGILWGNGQNLIGNPGLTTGIATSTSQPNSEFASLNGWDFDAEGFGNPRIFDPSVPGQAPWPLGFNNALIDLGADEMGQLIMAGFIPSTRVFSKNVPNAGVVDHTGIYFVQEPNLSLTRPVYTGKLGVSYPNAIPPLNNHWFQQVQTNPNPFPTGSNYTAGVKDRTVRIRLADPAFQAGNIITINEFMRNLICDFSPHLIMDAHPEWPNWFDNTFSYWSPVQKVGIYSSTSWFDSPDEPLTTTSNSFVSPDNWNLYYNPYGPTGGNNRELSAILSGHLNPPATWDPNASGGFPVASFLWPGVGTPGFTSPPYYNVNTYATDQWGLGDVTNVSAPYRIADHAPNTNWDGFRYNCEVQFPENLTWSNLQTFLVSNTDGEAALSSKAEARRVRYFEKLTSTIVSKKAYFKAIQGSQDWLKKKAGKK
jgi:hypothetical protein